MSAPRWLGPIGLRLAAAFVAVALAAVAVLAVVLLLVDRSDVNHLAGTQRNQTVQALSSALENAYQARGGWSGANLQPALALADAAGVGLAVDDSGGGVVLRVGPQSLVTHSGSSGVERPITVASQNVGTMRLGFPSGGLTPSEQHLRSVLLAAVGWSAGLAAAVALAVAIIVARAFVGPIRRFSGAAHALESGTSGARVGPNAGPGELGELGRAFDSMAGSLEREDRLRRALVADVAHELRTPVAVLQAETEALVDGVAHPTAETLGSLHEETIRLGRMVEDLQTLASAEAAGLHLERRPRDLSRVASEAAEALASRFQAADVRLIADLPPTVVVGDPYRFRQVVTNLLANAVKFTPAGGQVALKVDADGSDAVLEVTDTGPGVPEDEQALVWDRFYRGKAGRGAAGSGIGLAVVKELTAAHGGSVGLSSSPGGGSRFTVRVPLASISASQAP
jgi:two-component system, OmpR family, sensor histidine kinase BaeS